MAHVLDGEWDSTVFAAGGPITEDKFSLTVNSAGNMLDPAKSKHGANSVSGPVTTLGGKPRIHIVDDQAKPPANYFGVLIHRFPLANGKTLHVIAGQFVLPDGLKRTGGKKRADGQEEGTWVATKQG